MRATPNPLICPDPEQQQRQQSPPPNHSLHVRTWFLAASPMSRWSSSVKETYEGVMRFPWSLGQISTRPLIHTATHE